MALTLLLLIAGAALAFWADRHGQVWLDRTVRERIEQAVESAVVEGYHFRMDGLRTDFRSGDVLITGIALSYDSTLNDSLRQGVHAYLFRAETDTIALRGLSIRRLVLQQEVHVRSIEVNSPHLEYTIGDHRVALDAPLERFRPAGRTPLSLFAVREVRVTDAKASMHDLSGHIPVLRATGLGIQVQHVRVVHPGPGRRADLYMGHVDIHLDSMSTDIGQGYRLRFGHTRLSDQARRGVVRHIVLERTGPRTATTRTTDLQLEADSLVLRGPDIGGLIADQALRMRALAVHGARLRAELDKELPEGPSTGRALPPAALLALRFPIVLDSVLVADSRIDYIEHSDATGLSGAIRFTQLDAVFTGVNNMRDRPDTPQMIEGDIRTRFMDVAPLHATYQARLDGSDDFTFTASVDQLPIPALDTLTTHLLRLSLRSGTMDHLDLVMRGNSRKARGHLELAYSGLIAEVSSSASEAQRHRMFGSLMDHVMQADDGAGLSDRRKRSYTVERDTTRSVLTFIWHFTRTGLTRDLRSSVKERISTMLKKEREDRRQRRRR